MCFVTLTLSPATAAASRCPFPPGGGVCRHFDDWRPRAAEAVFTAIIAAQVCPGFGVNSRIILDLAGNYTIGNDYQDMRASIAARFRAHPQASCAKAYELYGPDGQPLPWFGDISYTGLIVKIPTGRGFLDR